MALYRLALFAAHRQPAAGRASSNRRAGHDRTGNACGQRGKRQYRRRLTAARCDRRSSDERNNERVAGRSAAETDGHS